MKACASSAVTQGPPYGILDSLKAAPRLSWSASTGAVLDLHNYDWANWAFTLLLTIGVPKVTTSRPSGEQPPPQPEFRLWSQYRDDGSEYVPSASPEFRTSSGGTVTRDIVWSVSPRRSLKRLWSCRNPIIKASSPVPSQVALDEPLHNGSAAEPPRPFAIPRWASSIAT